VSGIKVKVSYCRDCGEGVPQSCLSRRGLCAGCARARMRNAARQIRERSGPIFELWDRNTRLGKYRRRVVEGEQGE